MGPHGLASSPPGRGMFFTQGPGVSGDRRYKPGLESRQGSAGLSHVSCLSFFSFYAQRVGVLAEYSPFYDYVNVPVGGLTSGSPSRYHDDNDHQIMGE